MKRSLLTLQLTAMLLAAGVLGCFQRPFKGTSYASFREGNQYQFSGTPIRWEVLRNMKTAKGWEFAMVGRDSLGNELMRQHYLRRNGRLLWTGIEGAALGISSVRFEPGLWACPFTDRVGGRLDYTNIEHRSDPQQTRLRIRVNSIVEGIEDVTTPAGAFKKCIKVSAMVTYLDSTSSPFFAGQVAWWYAKGVGVVKSQSPQGDSELIFAKIGNRTLP